MVSFSRLPAELRVQTWSFISSEELPLMQSLSLSVSKVWNEEIGGTKSLYIFINNVTAVQLKHLLPRAFPRQVSVTIDCIYKDDYAPICTILHQHLSRISYLGLPSTGEPGALLRMSTMILFYISWAEPHHVCGTVVSLWTGNDQIDVSGQVFAGNAPIERLHLDGIQILEPQQAVSKVEYFSGTACWREAPREMPQVMTHIANLAQHFPAVRRLGFIYFDTISRIFNEGSACPPGITDIELVYYPDYRIGAGTGAAFASLHTVDNIRIENAPATLMLHLLRSCFSAEGIRLVKKNTLTFTSGMHGNKSPKRLEFHRPHPVDLRDFVKM